MLSANRTLDQICVESCLSNFRLTDMQHADQRFYRSACHFKYSCRLIHECILATYGYVEVPGLKAYI